MDIGGVSVCAVHNKIIKEGDPASIFELIVRDAYVARTLAGCKLLLDSMPTEPRNADNDMVTDGSMPYNRSMEALDHVVKASKLTAFKLFGAAPADGEGVADGVLVSCAVGLFVLKMTCAIKDVVAFAAIVHKNLLTTQGQAQIDDRDRIYGFVTNAIFYLKKSLVKLQQLVGESDSIEAESSGVKLPNPVAHVRQWSSNASSFAARSVDILLDVFSTFLVIFCPGQLNAETISFTEDTRGCNTVESWVLGGGQVCI